MTSEIHRRLAGLADEAPNPPDPDAILTRVRRRRQHRSLASAGVVALAVATLLALVGTGRPAGRTGQDAAGTGGSAAPVRLPRVITPPAGDVPLLPTDRAVGLAALAYRACQTCPALLLLDSGAQYRLEFPPAEVPLAVNPAGRALPVTISPDGRWLGVVMKDSLRMRDLTGTTQWTLPVGAVGAWSANSRWLAGPAMRADLRDGRTAAVRFEVPVHVVTDSGQVASILPADKSSRMELRLADPASGGQSSFTRVDVLPLLRTGEAVAPSVEFHEEQTAQVGGVVWSEVTGGGRDRMAIMVYRQPVPATLTLPVLPFEDGVGTPVPQPVRVAAVITATDGTLLERVELPAHAGRVAFDGEYLLLPVQAGRTDPVTLVRVSLVDGRDTLVSELPAQAYYVLRGTTYGVRGPAYPVDHGW